LKIGDLVLKELQNERHWMRQLKPDHNSWQGWLKSQWQVYWTALPIGKGKQFKTAAIPENVDDQLQTWLNQQNEAYNVSKKQKLFQSQELKFLREAYHQRLEEQHRKFSVNIGSWWAYIFDATRASLASV
ncbi:MAG: type III-B CRISPR-associated protein Cas10/Cmr2, partial [Dolichospermum sp.]